MRGLLIAASLMIFAATPAAAQYVHPADEEILRSLPDPGEIDAMGDAIGRTTDALMDVDLGPVVDAVDPARRYNRGHRGDTLGDIATRNDPYARARIQADIGAATAGISAMIEQIAVLAPALRRSIEDSRIRMEEAMRESRYRSRYRERGPYDDEPSYEGPDDWDR
ncbi:hypothetical protein [Sphingosinicella rhizophila]|uniref:LTXXQ motif family protein n=1 Tax=Sphingosinicella rhizophila TaxID=3050082 RepID=A0ABU3Q5I4_9SPHN|nr:hypothetical protein [Sphingosinicella sp. GR2756]MDT9598195.1 hypothetical protein [Sphingosinicella sp. GR2756]